MTPVNTWGCSHSEHSILKEGLVTVMEQGNFYPGDTCTHVYTSIGVYTRAHTNVHTCMYVREGGTKTRMGTQYRYTRAHAYTCMHTLRVPGHMARTSGDMKVSHCLSPLNVNVAGWVAESPPACFVEPKGGL